MEYHYEYNTYNSHHKALINLQASNIDAVNSKSCMPFSQIVFTMWMVCCKMVQEVVFIFCIHLIQVVTIIVYNGHNIIVCKVVSFRITTNKFNYRQYRKLTRHRYLPKQRRKFNAMTMISDV